MILLEGQLPPSMKPPLQESSQRLPASQRTSKHAHTTLLPPTFGEKERLYQGLGCVDVNRSLFQLYQGSDTILVGNTQTQGEQILHP